MITGHLYIPREGDRERFLERLEYWRSQSNEELVLAYNKLCEHGFFGVHAQGLSTIAQHKVFMERFGKSPIRFEQNTLLEFTGPIALDDNHWNPLAPSGQE